MGIESKFRITTVPDDEVKEPKGPRYYDIDFIFFFHIIFLKLFFVVIVVNSSLMTKS